MTRLRIGLLVGAVGLLVLLLVGLHSTEWLVAFGGKVNDARRARVEKSAQWNKAEGKFQNPLPTHNLVPGTFWQMVRGQFFGGQVREPPRPPPTEPRKSADYATPPASGLRATWIGHASTLVEIDGARVLFDPIFADRCSPSTLVGPRRFFPPPIALADLPAIDAVVISHDHFDHLDMVTARVLAARGTHYFVPLGIGAHLEAWQIPTAQIHELDWHESGRAGPLTLIATPARHYSGRNPLRGDQTLWASWVVASPHRRVFFSGDSGYFDGFAATATKYGPFDLSLIKIGACDPTWQQIHMSPQEAVKTHKDLGSKLLLPVHWGTFNLAQHAWNDPPEEMIAAAEKHGLRAGVDYVVPMPGQFVDAASPPPVTAWWKY